MGSLHSFDRALDKFMAWLSDAESSLESLEIELESYGPGVKTSRERALMQLKVGNIRLTVRPRDGASRIVVPFRVQSSFGKQSKGKRSRIEDHSRGSIVVSCCLFARTTATEVHATKMMKSRKKEARGSLSFPGARLSRVFHHSSWQFTLAPRAGAHVALSRSARARANKESRADRGAFHLAD